MFIKELSIEQRYNQLNTFVDLFVIEFMAEVTFLESVSRGNALERKNESMVFLFNISCALLSLVPIPGITFGFIALPYIVRAVTDIGKTVVNQPLVQEGISVANDYLQEMLKSKIEDNLTLTPPRIEVINNSQLVDKETMETLVRWVGIQLSHRYEQALTERLSIQPEEALLGLAREAARRSVSFLAKNNGSMNNRAGNEGRHGYIRHSVPGDGDCGYTALGVTRQDAIQLLLENIEDISNLIRTPIRSALLTEGFHQYLMHENIINVSHDQLLSDDTLLTEYESDLIIQSAYIQYDVKDRCIDAGYSHPSVLQAIAHIRHIELHIWRLGERNVLIPHIAHEENYAVYMPDRIESRVDLAFVNGNHFERLEIVGYEGNIPLEGIYPLNSSWNQNNMLFDNQIDCMLDLLNGVAIGQEIKWYLRPLKLFSREKLKGRDEAASTILFAPNLLTGGIWFQNGKFYRHSNIPPKTIFFSTKGLERLPKYGYTQGWIQNWGLIEYQDQITDFVEWENRRVFRKITKQELKSYCLSDSVKTARENQTTAQQTLSEYLHACLPSKFPNYVTLYIAEDLSDLTLANGNFHKVDFSRSRFSGDVSYADFSQGKFYACTFDEVSSKENSRVIFSNSVLSFSYFIEAEFNGVVDFTQAELSVVNFESAKFGRIDDIGAKWYCANLRGANYQVLKDKETEQVKNVMDKQKNQEEVLTTLNTRILKLEEQHEMYFESDEQHNQLKCEFKEKWLADQVKLLYLEEYMNKQFKTFQKKIIESDIRTMHLYEELNNIRHTIERIMGNVRATYSYPSRLNSKYNISITDWIVTFVNENNTVFEFIDKALASPSIIIEGLLSKVDGKLYMFIAKYSLTVENDLYKVNSEEFDVPIEEHTSFGITTKRGTDFIDDMQMHDSKFKSISYPGRKDDVLKMIGGTDEICQSDFSSIKSSIKQDALFLRRNPQSISNKKWALFGFFNDKLNRIEGPIEKFIHGKATKISPTIWCAEKLKFIGITHSLISKRYASSMAAGSSAYQTSNPHR